MQNFIKYLSFISIAIFIGCGDESDTNTETQNFSVYKLNSTDSKIALKNLDAQIESAKSYMSKNPDSELAREQLMNLLSTRVTVTGSYSDFNLMETLLFLEPTNSKQANINIHFYMATHQFDKVQEQLDYLEAFQDQESYEKALISLQLARGQNLNIIRRKHLAKLNKHKSHDALVKMAAIETELGEFQSAENYFIESLRVYKDTSPFPISYVHFQLGVMWAEKAGVDGRAERLYKEALQHIPQNPTAQVHLAEIEMKSGRLDSAKERLKTVLDSDDPEPAGKLAEVFIEMGQDSRASELIEIAKRKYMSLLKSYPYAFSDHGAEFFMGLGGDKSLAVELALLNLSNRESQRAYALAMKALRFNNNSDILCDVYKQAKAIDSITNIFLKENLDKTKELCL